MGQLYPDSYDSPLSEYNHSHGKDGKFSSGPGGGGLSADKTQRITRAMNAWNKTVAAKKAERYKVQLGPKGYTVIDSKTGKTVQKATTNTSKAVAVKAMKNLNKNDIFRKTASEEQQYLHYSGPDASGIGRVGKTLKVTAKDMIPNTFTGDRGFSRPNTFTGDKGFSVPNNFTGDKGMVRDDKAARAESQARNQKAFEKSKAQRAKDNKSGPMFGKRYVKKGGSSGIRKGKSPWGSAQSLRKFFGAK